MRTPADAAKRLLDTRTWRELQTQPRLLDCRSPEVWNVMRAIAENELRMPADAFQTWLEDLQARCRREWGDTPPPERSPV